MPDVGARELKTQASEIVRQVRENRVRSVITYRGEPVGLLMPLARQAMDVAAGHRLRGSGAVYAAVALRFGTTLVTLDQEQQERLESVITACQPA